MCSDHRNGDDGRSGKQRQSRNSGLPTVKAPIWAARSLRIDPEQFAFAKTLEARFERGFRGSTTTAINRNSANGAHKFLRCPALEPGPGEVVGLAHKDNLTVNHHGEKH